MLWRPPLCRARFQSSKGASDQLMKGLLSEIAIHPAAILIGLLLALAAHLNRPAVEQDDSDELLTVNVAPPELTPDHTIPLGTNVDYPNHKELPAEVQRLRSCLQSQLE